VARGDALEIVPGEFSHGAVQPARGGALEGVTKRVSRGTV